MNDSNPPVLYSFRRCPYAMRARLAIASQGIVVELREVVLRDKPQSMLDISPKGTVPVLQLADGRVIDESIDVMRWAFGEVTFTEQEQALITLNDGLFKTALDRYKYEARQEMQVEGKTAVDFREEAVDYLRQYEAYLSENASATRLQWALLPFVRQFRGVDEAWFDQLALPHLQRCLQQFLVSSLFKTVMKKYKAWRVDDQPLLTRFQEG